MKPCKAPADHEPVIPPDANLVSPAAGIDAVGGRLVDVAHRPERVAELTGLGLNEAITAPALATLLSHPAAGLKNVPAGARVNPLINKVETPSQLVAARQVARQVLSQEQVDRVIIAAIHSQQPLLETHRRVTAVVLAAGESARMGQSKQLLPWGDTTILGQVLTNLQASAVNEIVVVSGYEQQRVARVAAEAGVKAVYNPDYEAGEMLSSLQVAVSQLPLNREAVLVMLADQPMVGPEIINRLLEEYWQGGGELIAPTYQGHRGNPVLIGRRYFAELLALPRGEAPRTLLRAHDGAVSLVPVDSPGILHDLDTPGQYERWRPGSSTT
jgi:molybdenum cofactor cytidylyltransferase